MRKKPPPKRRSPYWRALRHAGHKVVPDRKKEQAKRACRGR